MLERTGDAAGDDRCERTFSSAPLWHSDVSSSLFTDRGGEDVRGVDWMQPIFFP